MKNEIKWDIFNRFFFSLKGKTIPNLCNGQGWEEPSQTRT